MLKLSGQRIVQRAPTELWLLLMDPQILRKCIPGCEQLEVSGPSTYRVALKIGLGLVRGRFHGEAELKDVVVHEAYRLEVRAKGTTGFIQGTTHVRLSPHDGGQATELSYESDAQVGGMLASVGARLFQSAARSFVDDFFDELSKL